MKIRLLDNNTINKIAAGEVVERPSSVVKELVENSIDAGASSVTVEIREGGTSLIKISDNGNGIEKDEVKSAFLRHATSKIEKIDDLENVISLGFRGEALASIVAVSQTEMITKTHDEETGTKIEIAGGNVLSFEEYAANNGTVISVKNLFYNVPARRKFLKKPSTESGYVSDIINKIALGHPEISLKYINNGNVILHTSGNNDLKTAVYHVYGKEILSQMMAFDLTQSGMRIYGLTGKPQLSRGTRTYENLFINGRFIKNDTVSQAVEDAYKTRLMIGKFPVFVLNLQLPPDCLDVNVHPAKLEVRFKDNDSVYDFVYTSVLDVFKDKVLIPEGSWDSKNSDDVAKLQKENGVFSNNTENTKISENKKTHKTEKSDFLLNEKLSEDSKSNKKYNMPFTEDKDIDDLKKLYQSSMLSDEPQKSVRRIREGNQSPCLDDKDSDSPQVKKFFNNYKIIGQLFNTYWLVEQGTSLFLIDQHAAHERVLFEKFYNSFKNDNVVSQRFIEPVMLNLSEHERNLIDENFELLEKSGFEIERLTPSSYALKGVPFVFNNPESVSYFNSIIDMLDIKQVDDILQTKILNIATMACKAAVKANDRLSFEEATSLINELLNLENPFSCPHGRPTIIELTKYELEKKFKRIQ
ncbi:MAG: DNA mismatch repair endonuclease MutL [Clostridia bacterium]|jgi:DNA mismatch repair protein MutL|nr:DNA mismatch repair endonuclease MutL [Clostridia bacterium]MCI2000370.1 DNA mismatch repair endonuclease MutL [Clostridia bacterium]MCI2015550.1 DNA mismatch repair endonuclease MutL [Clostridia bacterium]